VHNIHQFINCLFEQCSNLMLIESIPREPLGFHLIPFDCPRVQYTLQVSLVQIIRCITRMMSVLMFIYQYVSVI